VVFDHSLSSTKAHLEGKNISGKDAGHFGVKQSCEFPDRNFAGVHGVLEHTIPGFKIGHMSASGLSKRPRSPEAKELIPGI
jgi:hypothetical protein